MDFGQNAAVGPVCNENVGQLNLSTFEQHSNEQTDVAGSFGRKSIINDANATVDCCQMFKVLEKKLCCHQYLHIPNLDKNI